MKKNATIALTLAIFLFGIAAQASTLTVQASATVTVKPNRAMMDIGIRKTADTVSEAVSEVNGAMKNIVDALQYVGIEQDDISTCDIEFYPEYDYDEMEQLVGYTAYNALLVTTDNIDEVGTYIDKAIDAGANTFNGVEFYAEDTARAESQALILAVEKAREKAETIAAAAGCSLGTIMKIQENGTGSDASILYARAEDAVTGTRVYSGDQQVTASVTILFSLEETGE